MTESIKQRSREALRLQILRGTEEEVWPAFEELMRRNMEGEEGPDIWGEKPERTTISELKSKVIMTQTFGVYHASKMDAFHEKVKERLDDLKNDCDGFLKLASESTLRGAANRKKLEALELARNKLYEALPTGTVDAFDLLKVVQAHIADLDKILEAS